MSTRTWPSIQERGVSGLSRSCSVGRELRARRAGPGRWGQEAGQGVLIGASVSGKVETDTQWP